MEACKTRFVKKFNKEANAHVLAKTKKILMDTKAQMIRGPTNKLMYRKKVFSEILKTLKMRPSKEEVEFEKAMTIQKYCNPGCKGTVYQDTPYSKKDLEKKFAWCKGNCDRKSLIAGFQKSRKRVHRGLKDNFHKTIDQETKKRYTLNLSHQVGPECLEDLFTVKTLRT